MYLLSNEAIREKVRTREAKISVIGLGRVGLPLAATLADCGFETLGIDINEGLVKRINAGESPFEDEVGLTALLKRTVDDGKLVATALLEERDLNVITVPTLIKGEEPDIDAVFTVANAIKAPRGKVFSLESTVPPLTTERFGEIVARNTGYKPGEDFGMAYSPERVQAPQVLRDLGTYPKIVGGMDEKSGFIVSLVYSCFAPGIIRVSSPVVAEIDKIMENAQRDLNIAFANELARICEVYGIDVYEVIRTANSQPYCNILQPGLVGGHCIPMDPYYILSAVEQRGYTANLIKEARRVNEAMTRHVADMVEGDRVVILGLSFKPDIKTFENTHTLKLIDALKSHKVVVHDPFLDDEVEEEKEEEVEFEVEKDMYKAVEGADCIVLSTAHSVYKNMDWKELKKRLRGDLVVDVRGFFDAREVEANGLRYKGIGRIFRAG
ncbi:MAG: nucleotide sugar dehydrogenase [Halobacteriota archaeon]